MASSHEAVVREQFARQAASFEDPAYSFADARLMRWIVGNVPPPADGLVLDVAGGTGHLARAYAAAARCAIVLDLTEEMLRIGMRQARAEGLDNVLFERGDASAMAYLDGSFDLVISRFAVHHFRQPGRPLSEMARVCRPGGRVAIVDLVAPDPLLADDLNARERLRDPSHVTALLPDDLAGLLEGAGTRVTHRVEHDQAIPVERWLAQTAPEDEIAEQLRTEMYAELDGGRPTGLRPVRRDGELHLTQRWAILVAERTGEL